VTKDVETSQQLAELLDKERDVVETSIAKYINSEELQAVMSLPTDRRVKQQSCPGYSDG
jgi:putative heme iron utilization protein